MLINFSYLVLLFWVYMYVIHPRDIKAYSHSHFINFLKIELNYGKYMYKSKTNIMMERYNTAVKIATVLSIENSRSKGTFSCQ